MSRYTDFVKSEMPSVKHLPPKQRMVEIGKRWRQKGSGAELKGGAVKAKTKTKQIAMVAPRNEVYGRGHMMMADTPANQLLGYGKIPANEIGSGISPNFFRKKDMKTLSAIGNVAKSILPIAGALL